MKGGFFALAVFYARFCHGNRDGYATEKQPIKAIYIPPADHYAGIAAYEKYRDEMKKTDCMIDRIMVT